MIEQGRVRPGSRPGLSSSFGSTPGTPRGRPTTPGGPPLTVAHSAAPPLAMLDDQSYFAAMQQDVLLLQRRLRAFATPRKGTEVSEGSLQLITGGSNAWQAKVALHELLSDKMAQLERAVVQATAHGAEDAPAGTGPNSRLSHYLLALDRLQRLHAHALDAHAGEPVADGGDHAAAAEEEAQQLRARLQHKERLNASLERELMEAQAALRAREAETERLVDAARAEGTADSAQPAQAVPEEEAERLRVEAEIARREADGLRAQLEQLGAKLHAEQQARAASDARAASAARAGQAAQERESERSAAALLQQRNATILGLRRALSELQAEQSARATGPADASHASQLAELQAALAAERSAARSRSDLLSARIDELSAQLGNAGSDEKSVLAHMRAENERLEVRAGGRGAKRFLQTPSHAAELRRAAPSPRCPPPRLAAPAQADVRNGKDVLAAAKREMALLQQPAGDSCEEVMIEELRNMREAFDAKLRAASEAARDRQTAHRRELRCAAIPDVAPRVPASLPPWRASPHAAERATPPRFRLCLRSEMREAFAKERGSMESRMAQLMAKLMARPPQKS